jgi:hypothetical protein
MKMTRKEMLQLASAIDIPVNSDFLPDCFKPKGSKIKSVNAGKILAKIFKREDEVKAKAAKDQAKADREARVLAYTTQVELTGNVQFENEDTPVIDNNYVMFYGKLVIEGVADPITEDDILEYNFDKSKGL